MSDTGFTQGPAGFNRQAQLACVDSAWVLVVLMGIGLLLAGWVPPIAPELGPSAVQAVYRADTDAIRFACVLIMTGGGFYWPFSAAISDQMKRIEGFQHHPLSSVQLAAASGTVFAIIIASACWMVAAFRLDRMPELVQLIDDLGWILFIGTISPALVQLLAITLCAISERTTRRVFPRWYGFFNLWCLSGFLAGEAVCFFQTGPFAWNGAAAFWMAAGFFFGWILVSWAVIRRSIQQQSAAGTGVPQ